MTELRFETPMPLMSVQMGRPDQVDQVVDANGPAEALLGAADPVVVDQAAAALRKAAAEVVREHREFLAQAEEQLLDLAIDIARKVLMQEVQAQRYEIQPIVAEALKRVPEELDVTVYLNPDDLAGLAEFDGEQGPSLPRAVTWTRAWSNSTRNGLTMISPALS